MSEAKAAEILQIGYTRGETKGFRYNPYTWKAMRGEKFKLTPDYFKVGSSAGFGGEYTPSQRKSMIKGFKPKAFKPTRFATVSVPESQVAVATTAKAVGKMQLAGTPFLETKKQVQELQAQQAALQAKGTRLDEQRQEISEDSADFKSDVIEFQRKWKARMSGGSLPYVSKQEYETELANLQQRQEKLGSRIGSYNLRVESYSTDVEEYEAERAAFEAKEEKKAKSVSMPTGLQKTALEKSAAITATLPHQFKVNGRTASLLRPEFTEKLYRLGLTYEEYKQMQKTALGRQQLKFLEESGLPSYAYAATLKKLGEEEKRVGLQLTPTERQELIVGGTYTGAPTRARITTQTMLKQLKEDKTTPRNLLFGYKPVVSDTPRGKAESVVRDFLGGAALAGASFTAFLAEDLSLKGYTYDIQKGKLEQKDKIPLKQTIVSAKEIGTTTTPGKPFLEFLAAPTTVGAVRASLGIVTPGFAFKEKYLKSEAKRVLSGPIGIGEVVGEFVAGSMIFGTAGKATKFAGGKILGKISKSQKMEIPIESRVQKPVLEGKSRFAFGKAKATYAELKRTLIGSHATEAVWEPQTKARAGKRATQGTFITPQSKINIHFARVGEKVKTKLFGSGQPSKPNIQDIMLKDVEWLPKKYRGSQAAAEYYFREIAPKTKKGIATISYEHQTGMKLEPEAVISRDTMTVLQRPKGNAINWITGYEQYFTYKGKTIPIYLRKALGETPSTIKKIIKPTKSFEQVMKENASSLSDYFASKPAIYTPKTVISYYALSKAKPTEKFSSIISGTYAPYEPSSALNIALSKISYKAPSFKKPSSVSKKISAVIAKSFATSKVVSVPTPSSILGSPTKPSKIGFITSSYGFTPSVGKKRSYFGYNFGYDFTEKIGVGGFEPPEPPPVIGGRKDPYYFEAKQPKKKGFNVLVRGKGRKVKGKWKKGTFVKVNRKPLDKFSALSLGARAVDETVARSFKIIETNKSASKRKYSDWGFLAGKFRPSKKGRSAVEKTAYAIDTFGELRGITAKGWATRHRQAVKRRMLNKMNLL